MIFSHILDWFFIKIFIQIFNFQITLRKFL